MHHLEQLRHITAESYGVEAELEPKMKDLSVASPPPVQPGKANLVPKQKPGMPAFKSLAICSEKFPPESLEADIAASEKPIIGKWKPQGDASLWVSGSVVDPL